MNRLIATFLSMTVVAAGAVYGQEDVPRDNGAIAPPATRAVEQPGSPAPLEGQTFEEKDVQMVPVPGAQPPAWTLTVPEQQLAFGGSRPLEADTPLPEEIGELFEMALEHNPEIRAAQAELQAAMARLEQMRSEVLQQVAELKARLDVLKEIGVHGEMAAADGAFGMGTDDGMDGFGRRGVRSEELERRLRHEVGIPQDRIFAVSYTPTRIDRGAPGVALGEELNRPAISEVLAATYDTSLALEFENELLQNILGFISEELAINILCDPAISNQKIPYIRLSDVPARQAFLAISDMIPGTVFLMRDYGVYATTREQALTMAAPSIPEIPLFAEAPEQPGQAPAGADVFYAPGRVQPAPAPSR